MRVDGRCGKIVTINWTEPESSGTFGKVSDLRKAIAPGGVVLTVRAEGIHGWHNFEHR